jgi:type I restriction enzyme, S subunit
MAGERRDVFLGDLVEIQHGFAFAGAYFSDEPPGGILLTPGNFAIGGGFQASKPKYYGGPVPDDFVLDDGDLLVTMTDLSRGADTLGYPALVPRGDSDSRFLHNQRLGKILVKPYAPLDKQFLYYLLCSREYRREILASATGTTVRHTSPSRIGRFRFQLPPLNEQHAIAHILGPLDEKIQSDRHLGDTLESIGRTLFKSWFVDFDPVRAKADGRHLSVRGDVANLFPDSFEWSGSRFTPKGWRQVEMCQVMDFAKGHKPRAASPGGAEGSAPVILIDTFDTGRSEFAFREGMLEAFSDDVLMVMDGASSGRVETGYEGLVGSTLAKVVPNDVVPGRRLLYYALKNLEPETRQHLTGTSIPHTDKGWIARQTLVLPDSDLLVRFEDAADQLRRRVDLARAERRTLAAVRDILLPGLISGELRVSQAERVLEAAPI